MITIRPGSHMSKLLSLLSVSGEFPTTSLHLLGDTRTIRAMIHRYKSSCDFRLQTEPGILTARVFQTSGTGQAKTLRLCKSALPLLKETHPDALGYYMGAFNGHRFNGNTNHIERRHRIGEALAMAMMSGAEIRPYNLPGLQKRDIRPVRLTGACFYVARYLKTLYEAEYNKFKYTRIVGAMLYPGGAYAVYNTRSAAMKWKGKGERNSREDLSDIVRYNLGLERADSAIFMGTNANVALDTLLEARKIRQVRERFDSIYDYIHFVPLNQDGIKLLKILTLPDWKETMLDAIFDPDTRPTGHTSAECDAILGDRLAFSHLDGDIARLVRLREAISIEKRPYLIVCFPWQRGYLAEFLSDVSELVSFREFGMDAVMDAMGMLGEEE